jgi:phage gp45-like
MARDVTSSVKRAKLSRTSSDDGNYHVAQVNYMGKVCDVELLTPYGLYSNLPEDGIATIWNVQGQEENRVGIGNTPKTRYKNLLPGEVVVGSPLAETKMEFLAEGVVKITGKNNCIITIDKDGNISMTTDGTLDVSSKGNLSMSTEGDMTLAADGDITIDGTTIELNGSGTPLSTDSTVQTN